MSRKAYFNNETVSTDSECHKVHTIVSDIPKNFTNPLECNVVYTLKHEGDIRFSVNVAPRVYISFLSHDIKNFIDIHTPSVIFFVKTPNNCVVFC